MIEAYIFRNKKNDIYGFKVFDHGSSIVCSAVSILALNTVNSIENFTDAEFECEYDDEGGFLQMRVPNIKEGSNNHDVNLLLNSFLLGIRGIKLEYNDEIEIFDEEVL